MKKALALLALAALPLLTTAQSKWEFTTIAEEGIYFSTDNLADPLELLEFRSLAANSGMSAGFLYNFSDAVGVEARLGLGATSERGAFFTKIVPVEIAMHYDLLDLIGLNTNWGFNADLAVGSSLTSVNTGTGTNPTPSYSFDENFSAGASLDVPLNPMNTLSFGYRHTAYISDINGTDDGLDMISRFFTGVSIRFGKDRAGEKALAEAVAKADELTASLKKAEEESGELKTKLSGTQAAHAQEVAALMDEIEALKANPSMGGGEAGEGGEAGTGTMDANGEKGYYVIIGSYPSQESAQRFISSTGNGYVINYVESLNTYRVVHSKHLSYSEAKEAREEAKNIEPTAWIAVY